MQTVKPNTNISGNHSTIVEFKTLNKSYQSYDQMIKRYIPVSMNTRSEKVGYLIKKHYTNDTPFTGNLTNMIHVSFSTKFDISSELF